MAPRLFTFITPNGVKLFRDYRNGAPSSYAYFNGTKYPVHNITEHIVANKIDAAMIRTQERGRLGLLAYCAPLSY